MPALRAVAQRLVDDLGARSTRSATAPRRTDGATGLVEDGEAITADLHDVRIVARPSTPGWRWH